MRTASPTRSPVPSRTVTLEPTDATVDRYNCADFANQAAAQAFLRQYPNDPSRLDEPDKDGIACESRPVPRDLTPVPRS